MTLMTEPVPVPDPDNEPAAVPAAAADPAAEDTPAETAAAAVPDTALAAALEAAGVEVLYRADGTPVVRLPTPEPTTAAAPPRPTPKRPTPPTPPPAAAAVPGVTVAPHLDANPHNGIVDSQGAYELAKTLKTATPTERAAILGGVKVTT